MLFRVVIVTTLLLAAVYVEFVSETLLEVNPLYWLIAATYGLTILYVVALRTLPGLQVQAFLQVVLDLAINTGLIYVAGGAGSRAGFLLLYPISVLSGAVLLYHRRWGLVLAVLGTVFYAAMLYGVRSGRITANPFSDIPWIPVQQLVYLVFVTGVSCVTVALIGSYMGRSLRRVGEQLERTAEAMAGLEELNQLIVDSIHSGLATTDLSGRLLWVNALGASILGRAVADLRGRTLREVFASPRLEESVLSTIAGRAHFGRLELPYRTPAGVERELGVSVTPLAAAEPGRRGFLLVYQDLTDIKRREQEVGVKEKLAAVGEMAAQLAHEIRNPLGSISGSAQVLMAEPNMSSEHAHLLSIITRESKRLSDALNQFLYQVRPAGGPRGPIDVGRVIAEAVTLLRNSPEVKPTHRVEFEGTGGPHLCQADPDQIRQVFWNLSRNGLEAMPDGGTLTIRLSAHDGQVRISFGDEGRGMSREEQRRVFEPFRSGSPMGTGLGLAIVYRIVREHGGDISLRSIPERGTEVEVRLPLVAAAALA
jgi:two-component system sensor histidine kinase PilS (NtrC family)